MRTESPKYAVQPTPTRQRDSANGNSPTLSGVLRGQNGHPNEFMKAKIILCFALVLGGGLLGCQPAYISATPPAEKPPPGPSVYDANVLEILRKDLEKGTPEQKERALEAVDALGAVRLLPEVMKAIEDPTSLPRHGDTGWGFVGHEAATVMWKIAQALDGIELNERGYRAYSFWGDSGEGGEKLTAAGRLAEVRRNWEKWWRDRSKNKVPAL